MYAEEDILDLTGEVIVKAGEFLAKAESAEDETLRFDIDLPHGKYMVKELEAAQGYLKTTGSYARLWD
ncbi:MULTISPECIES: SpaA isopeptide-forming pilin-related protein [Lachnospiraceae]|uniref:SpaA isopeptide-forming pilin-related protein n=1 Tax=Lachnospiraceae TaxID=186803 RepID=UPI0014025152